MSSGREVKYFQSETFYADAESFDRQHRAKNQSFKQTRADSAGGFHYKYEMENFSLFLSL